MKHRAILLSVVSATLLWTCSAAAELVSCPDTIGVRQEPAAAIPGWRTLLDDTPHRLANITSTEFTDRLKAEGIRISMDGRGRALDIIFVERLWRSVKYEEVYLHDYATVTEALLGLKKYFLFYNTERQHSR